MSILSDFDYFSHYIRLFDEGIETEILNRGLTSVEVDWMLLPRQLQTLLDTESDKFFEGLQQGLYSRIRILDPEYPTEKLQRLSTRLHNLPHVYSMLDLNTDLLKKFIAVDCIVTRNTTILPMIKKAYFLCVLCGAGVVIEQKELKLRLPVGCKGTTKRGYGEYPCRGRFELDLQKSTFEDTQILTLQERPEENRENTNPVKIVVRLPPNLIESVRAGDRATVYGVMEPVEESKKSRIFAFTIDVNNVKVLGDEVRVPNISEADRQLITELSRDPEIQTKIIASIAPSIYGYPNIKQSIAMILFGGVRKTMPDGIVIRGDLHCLIVGDPGTAKSVLLKYAKDLSPRGVYAVGGGASGVGLTASLIKEKGEENFTLVAGTVVLANGGIACIDEMDKINKDDLSKIHEGMAQQTVTISKAGFNAVLPARCSVLAAANPKDGRYDPYHTVRENLTFPPTLLSRFDLIWIIKDIPEVEHDLAVTEHMLMTQTGAKSMTPPIPPLLLKKYVATAKAINPVLDDEARNTIKAFYSGLRNQSSGNDGAPMSITPRQLESVIRLTEASARLHLREEATGEDALNAIKLMRQSLEQVGFDVETGLIDVDQAMGGVPRTLREKRKVVLAVIDKLTSEDVDFACYADIYELCQLRLGLTKDELDRILLTLSDELIQSKNGSKRSYRRMRGI